MQDHNRHGAPSKPTQLPFLNQKSTPPVFKVHTAETIINGKTYVTETVETSGGSRTRTYEKKPQKKEKWSLKNKVEFALMILLLMSPFLFVVFLLVKGSAGQ